MKPMPSTFVIQLRAISRFVEQHPSIICVIGFCFIGCAILSVAASCTSPACPPQLGSHAPDFTLQTIEGTNVKLSDLRGKIVMVYTWSRICPLCVEDMPQIQIVFDKWASRGLVILGINELDRLERIKDFIRSQGLTFTILLDRDASFRNKYCLPMGDPCTIFINRRGHLEKYRFGGWCFDSPGNKPEVINTIDRILNEIDLSRDYSN